MYGFCRSVLGQSQKGIADSIGITQKCVSEWLSGKSRPRLYLHQVEALMETTGKTIPELRAILDPEH